MGEGDLHFCLGLVLGAIIGYLAGHGRGYTAGVRWCTKLLDEPFSSNQRVEK